MPKYRVVLWYHFSVDYDVEANNKEAARQAAFDLNNQETETEMISHASNAPELVDSFVEAVGKEDRHDPS